MMYAIHFYKDGSSSDNIFPKNGSEFEQNELESNDKRIAYTGIYGMESINLPIPQKKMIKVKKKAVPVLYINDTDERKEEVALIFAELVHPLYEQNNWTWSETLKGENLVPSIKDIQNLVLRHIDNITVDSKNHSNSNRTYMRASGRIMTICFEWDESIIRLLLQP